MTSVHRFAASCMLPLAIALIPLGACTSSQRGASASLDELAPPRGALLTVENRNLLDARLYVVRSGLRIRLGTIQAHERRTFVLWAHHLGPRGLVLETELVPSRERYLTHRVTVARGDRLDWLIGHRLAFSRVTVSR
jgi:hypothetical protein